ncbi:MAG: pesticidal protein Cry7Aa [Bacteroidetes bacterium B1(2017)]|nr:MAG: pesticidal protein Cry7Aa [Bacteroidetes bacterium B1(2017)]
MINVKNEGVILQKTTFGFENEGVLNPGVIKEDSTIHMFYRAVAKGNYSSIGYCSLNTPLTIDTRFDSPILFPQFEYESHGMEDPRICKIDDLFYLTYTAYDGHNAIAALATSLDLIHFEKKGLIMPQILFKEFHRLASSKQSLNEKYVRFNDHGGSIEKNGKPLFLWDKNVVFFPRRIHGKLCLLHRIKPDIQLVAFDNIGDLNPEFWQHYFLHLQENIVLAPIHPHEVSYIGSGCPPIETSEGWLLIYHGVYDTVAGYVYVACAALLDLENPQIEIARLPYPLFKPRYTYEILGYVNNVCFPTGAVVELDRLFIYYGAADEQIAVASLNLKDLVSELLLHAKKL